MFAYYFTIADTAQDEDGDPCEAYCKVDFPVWVDCETVIAYMTETTGIAKDRWRSITPQEYFENADDEDDGGAEE